MKNLFRFLFFPLAALKAVANPTGLSVQSGSASAVTSGNTLNITASQNAFLNWQTFNIAAGEKTIFNQPSANSIVWNKINDANASQIYGSLQANGVVVLMNSAGFYFGPNSFVSAAGLVVSTANCLPPENNGGTWEFNGPPPLASIVNYGQLKMGNGGSAFLIADQVENHGDIEAPGGSIGLAAGQTVQLNERPDGRGLSMAVTLPSGSVNNYGNLVADGGTIALHAKVVNQNGLLQADSIREQNGSIELVASDTVNLGANSLIIAHGDDSTAGSAGGTVTIKSDNIFCDTASSAIVTTGGAKGGTGGNIEVSAPNIQSLDSAMDASAAAGSVGGQFLVDPINITLTGSGTTTSGATPDSGGTVNGLASNTANWNLNVNTAFKNKNFSTITLEASGNITVSANLSWDLSGPNGYANGSQLNLLASGNITFGNNSSIVDENSWSISMMAGYNFTTKTVQSGTGSIFFNGGNNLTGGGFVQTTAGNISLVAGKDIQAYSGGAETFGGGSITATALGGNINISGPGYLSTLGGGDVTATAVLGSVYIGANSTAANIANIGSSLSGFGASYLNNGSYASYLSGISTGGGGDVKIVAGGNIYSYLPTGQASYNYDDPGSGAFGSGNVTLIADGNITGHYQLFAGVGSIFAGYKTDANGNPIADSATAGGNAGSANTAALALSLTGIPASQNGGIASGWNVNAQQNILLQEVRNPQGVFGDLNGAYTFNYASDSYLDLTAGNSIQLGSSAALPRISSNPGADIPIILPPTLKVTAGKGGILLADSILLYPSAQGSLSLTTLNGGPLATTDWNLASSTAPNPKLDPAAPDQLSLLMSDSSDSVFSSPSSFTGHAATPLHASSPTTVAVNISGDMGNVVLNVPEAATVNVVGNLYNSGFIGQNVVAGDTTAINVGATAVASMKSQGILNNTTAALLTVGGNIENFNQFQSIDISYLPDFSQLQYAVINGQIQDLSALAGLINVNSTPLYDAATGKYDLYALTYQGQMTAAYYNYLTSLNVAVGSLVDGNFTPSTDTQGNLVTKPVSLLTSADATALQTASQSSPASDSTPGILIGGGGKLVINANSADLGSSPGIQSVGPGTQGGTFDNANLNYFSKGADIDISLAGDLTMFASSIATLSGGDIDITSTAGAVTAGTTAFAGNSSNPRGIYTALQGDVSVTAYNDISVAGSRIAAYDGGNVTVESQHGNVDAGSGGNGSINLEAITFNSDHQRVVEQVSIAGSGFITETLPPPISPDFPASQIPVGNILVEAPNGNITANQAGVIQIGFNNVDSPNATVLLLAGLELQDLAGNPLKAGDWLAGYKLVATKNTVFPYDFADIVDSHGNAVGRAEALSDKRNIDATGSGVIAQNAVLKATGDVNGLVFANNADISAKNNITLTLVASGQADVSAGNNVSGTIIGLGGINASGGNIEASLLSQNVTASGTTSGEKGFAQGNAAGSASQGMSSDETTKTAKTTDNSLDGDADAKKRGKGNGIGLAQKVSRVTVLLPAKY